MSEEERVEFKRVMSERWHKNYEKNKERWNETRVRYRKKYPKEKSRYGANKSHARRKIYVLSHYANPLKCSICGETDLRCLSLDHINGGGLKHRKSIRCSAVYTMYGNDFYKWVIDNKFPDGYQVLCMNCQWKKQLSNLTDIYNELIENGDVYYARRCRNI